MKLYMAAGQYVGTQADARKLDKDFTEVEVPTDKPGLMAFLNDLRVVDPAATEEQPETPVGNGLSYAEQSVGGDEWFASVPVEHQLTLTQLALENARNEIGRLKSLERGGISTAETLANRMGATFEEPEYDKDVLPAEETDPFA